MTPKTVLEVQGSASHTAGTLRLGTWRLAEGEVMHLSGASMELVTRAFLGLEPDADIRIVGAKVGSREARTAYAMTFAGFEPVPALKVLEHLALAVRIGPPRLGKVPSFRQVLDDVGLTAFANTPASQLRADGRLRLSLAMTLVRLLPVWVLMLPASFEPSPGVVQRIKDAVGHRVAIVLWTEAEALANLAGQSRRLEVRATRD
ncbi:MAG: hypothetical protein ACYCWN_01705 [Ferrimicrobium sp.]|uniref:Uncharacterized protein n=1 Tax=Ferrimicrobium acidiphilum TaxID=121039 RepID=A0ABV3XYB6_9ACTN|nr:hypothetical protein [Ferrimicrobium sp.]MCL5973743.1 hypothetical protein [Actinomycetota bacterium]